MTVREDVFKKLKANPKLPTPSRTALEILRLCRSDTSSLREIAQVIQVDPALSAEVLKFANCAFLATGIQVASIQKATVKLGMKTVMNLALCFSLLSVNKDGNCAEFNYENFWSTSLAQAIAAKTLASLGSVDDPDEMFVCGLLSHIGELALASLYPKEYSRILIDQPSREARINLERCRFGIDSAELTTELFLDWGLPAPYVLAAGFHEDLATVDLGESTTRRVTELLHVSHQIALLCQGVHISTQSLTTIEKMVQTFDGINEDFSTVFDKIVRNWHESGDTFKIKTRKCAPYDEIKASINATD